MPDTPMGLRRPKQTPGFRLEALDAEILLYHPAKTTTLYLNETASLVWRLCDGIRTTDEIEQLLQDAFPADEATIRRDVESALQELAKLDAITFG